MWQVIEGPTPVAPLADHARYRYVLGREADRRELHVELSGTVAACGPESLPEPLGEMVRTHGLTAVERHLPDDEPPVVVVVHTAGWRPVYRDLSRSRD